MTARIEKLMQGFITLIVNALTLVLLILVAVGTAMLFFLIWHNSGARVAGIADVEQLQNVIQRGLGGVLIVMLGLELLESIRLYQHEHRIRVEMVFFVALIAVGRHVIQLDYHNAGSTELFGTASVWRYDERFHHTMQHAQAGPFQVRLHNVSDPYSNPVRVYWVRVRAASNPAPVVTVEAAETMPCAR